MGLCIGKDKANVGKFIYELWIGSDTVETVGGFDSPAEAEKAGQVAQRVALFPAVESEEPQMSLEDIFADMDDAGLLAELGL